jgi:hypothetical protein
LLIKTDRDLGASVSVVIALGDSVASTVLIDIYLVAESEGEDASDS